MNDLDKLKADMLGQAEYSLNAPVSAAGITLAADPDDRAKFDGLRALIDGGAITGDVTLKDASGAFHTMTASAASAALLAYGAACYERWVRVETLRAQLAAAPDEPTARAAFSAWQAA